MAQLFTPYTLRGMHARNRVVISPMQLSSGVDGMAGDWHLAHLSRFAMGGAGIVFVESTAVEATSACGTTSRSRHSRALPRHSAAMARCPPSSSDTPAAKPACRPGGMAMPR